MDITNFNWVAYRMIYPLQLLSSGLVLIWNTNRRSKFWLRLLSIIFLELLLAVAIPLNIAIGSFYIPVNSLSLLLGIFLLFYMCFDISLIVAALLSALSSLVQHAAYCIEELMNGYWFHLLETNIYTDILRLFLRLVILTIFITVVYYIIKRTKFDVKEISFKSKYIFAFILFSIIITNFLSHNLMWKKNYGYISILFDLISTLSLLVIILFTNDLVSKKNILELKLEEEQRHYQSLSASIDLVNQRVHDFKHYMKYIKEGISDDKKGKEIERIEENFAIYESFVKTGNIALDNTLNESAILCKKENIQFLCSVDGGAVSMLSPIDTYVIFGNLMDNAVNEVRKYSEGNRFISISSKEIHEILFITIENYCDGKIIFEGGLPKTTKKNKLFHGIGLKSVRETLKKYGAKLTVNHNVNIFSVTLMFPLTQIKEIKKN